MADHPRLILQVQIEDRVSPFLRAFNEALLRGGGAPPLPSGAVLVEQHEYRGGGSIRLLPSAALLAWMGDVVMRHEAHLRRDEEFRAARLAGEGAST